MVLPVKQLSSRVLSPTGITTELIPEAYRNQEAKP
jgi:hypothetical protein